MYKISIIGAGRRILPLAKLLCEKEDFKITAICDIDTETAKKRYEEFKDVVYYEDAEKMLSEQKCDGIIIGTRCSTHTKYALIASKYNVPIFLEKPVCTTESDLEKLKGLLHLNDKIVVSFPLRLCYMTRCVKEIVESGRIGKIEHVQAYNNVNYARGYYHKWYRDENETGGLLLQKATHDFDYINYLLGDNKPVKICAMKSKQIFKGDMPEGLRCKDCDKKYTCPEGVNNINTVYGDPYEIKDYCCFATDTGNEDSSSAIVMYESGMHVVYSQNFIARRGAGKRGARLISYDATLEFDFNSGEIKIYYHNEDRVETHKAGTDGTHFGGDNLLMDNFADVVRGCDISHSDLKSGILSAKMCLMAKKSTETDKFYDI